VHADGNGDMWVRVVTDKAASPGKGKDARKKH
jgi:hypothetical protein